MTKQDHILHRSWELANTASAVKETNCTILALAAEQGFDEDAVFGIHLALEEAFTNAVVHGNRSNPEKRIDVEFLITPEKLDISITDEGQGFDPDEVPDPRCNGNLYKSSGRGVLLIKAYMDVVEYNQRGNCVHLVKYRRGKEPAGPDEGCSR